MSTLPTVTEAQVVAAQLRHEATRLIRLDEQLEATVPEPKRRAKSKPVSMMGMVKQSDWRRG